MGPQLYRCGNLTVLETTYTTHTRFNGAATLSLRKCACGSRPPLAVRASMGPQLYRCGNVIVSVLVVELVVASMGPQLYRCGNMFVVEIDGSIHHTLQWGRNFIVAEMFHKLTGTPLCIIASMGPQLYRCGNYTTIAHLPYTYHELQWGRNFIVAEMQVLRAFPASIFHCFNGAATLSLRKCRMSQSTRPATSRFNGAATLSLRKSQVSGDADPRQTCFNGAATLSLRKFVRPASSFQRSWMLQWGRNFIVAEMCIRVQPPWLRLVRFNGAATLSLRKYPVNREIGTLICQLQWGRNFIVAEIWDASRPCYTGGRLQWGRNFIVAEIFINSGGPDQLMTASMGPQLYRCGNTTFYLKAYAALPCFNGAATLSLRK